VSALALRRATMADAKRLWEWANDEMVRRVSFNPQPIAWDDHEAWLAMKLAAPRTRIWVLEENDEPVGQVRYDSAGDLAEIGYSVAAAARGHGLGAALLGRSAPLACRELGVRRLVGLVRDGNQASCRTFERAGFTASGTEPRDGVRCTRYTWSCADGHGRGAGNV
jgi:RimJ/RimL family protein N-acetyltransferase